MIVKDLSILRGVVEDFYPKSHSHAKTLYRGHRQELVERRRLEAHRADQWSSSLVYAAYVGGSSRSRRACAGPTPFPLIIPMIRMIPIPRNPCSEALGLLEGVRHGRF
jgi:hypothetical protein